jgi:DNA-binding NarL/FixJ family response regulator
MAKRIKVLIADDHSVVREGLKMLISTESDMEIVGEAVDGQQAVALARTCKPDVIIMDALMPACNGVQATRRLTRLLPKSRILVLSAIGDEELAERMWAAGAAGYLSKRSAPAHLLQGIREVQQGTAWFTPPPANAMPGSNNTHSDRQIRGQRLTARETQVLTLVAEGFSNKRIAADLKITLATVRTHRQQLMDKLRIHGVARLTQYAIANRLVAQAPGPSAGKSPAGDGCARDTVSAF